MRRVVVTADARAGQEAFACLLAAHRLGRLAPEREWWLGRLTRAADPSAAGLKTERRVDDDHAIPRHEPDLCHPRAVSGAQTAQRLLGSPGDCIAPT